jgi:hypothetical protein
VLALLDELIAIGTPDRPAASPVKPALRVPERDPDASPV